MISPPPANDGEAESVLGRGGAQYYDDDDYLSRDNGPTALLSFDGFRGRDRGGSSLV